MKKKDKKIYARIILLFIITSLMFYAFYLTILKQYILSLLFLFISIIIPFCLAQLDKWY